MKESTRGVPFPELEGDELLNYLLSDIEDEERLAFVLGVDLTPACPRPEHAPRVYAPLEIWLRRSEEIHAFRESAWRREHALRRDEHSRTAFHSDVP